MYAMQFIFCLNINKKTMIVMVKIVSNLSNVDLDGGMILGTNNSVASRARNNNNNKKV